jgi:hypothetical protein
MNYSLSKKYFLIFRYSLLIVILNGTIFSSFSQIIISTKVNESSNGVSLDFITSAEGFIKVDKNQNYFDFNSSIDESTPGKPILPSQIFIFAIPPYSEVQANLIDKTEKSFTNTRVSINPQIIQNEDSTFSYQEVELSSKYLNNEVLPINQVEVLEYFWIRDFYCVAIKINPVQFEWKSKSLKIISNAKLDIVFKNQKTFELNTSALGNYDQDLKDVIKNYSSAQNFRAKRNISLDQDSLGNWIDYSKTYYKLAISRDGIYRITYNDLVSYGITPTSINPKMIKIFRQGKQIPLYVKGEDDISFNQTDYIEFWGEKNYGKSNYRDIVEQRQDYINYMDRYNDTAFVWLSFGGENGKRFIIQNSASIGTSDTIKSYLNKQHLERDIRLWYHSTNDPRTQLPFWQEHKVFTWLLSGNSGSQSVTFNATDFVLNTPVKAYTRLISNSGDVILNCHKHGSSLNSTTPEDTITFDYLKSVNFVTTFNSNQLLEGSNTYRIFGFASAASFHRSLVDWIDIEYIRQNKALSDSITIVIPDTVNLSLRNVQITNLTTPDSLILIYKVGRENKKILQFNYTGGTLVFSDTVKGNDKYIITKQSYFITPSYSYSRGFANLRDITKGADCIIITHKSLNQSTQEYKQFIETSYNLRVERIFIEDIYDEFSFGQNWAESIKEFLIYTKDNWLSPAPSFVTIIGDANYDYKNIWSPAPSPRKKNLVPSYGFPVSDQWYAMWDSTNINIPQIYIGRIPANKDSEVRTYLTKHQNYINRRYDDWNKRYTLFSGGDPTKISELLLIKSTNDLLMNTFINPAPVGGNVTHFYKTTNPITNFGPYTTEQVENTIDSSGLFISYLGHSGTRTWDNGITEVEDLKSLFEDRTPLVSDFGCSTGKFAEPDVDAFGELFVCQSSNGQAIGYLGNSSLGFFSTSLKFPELFYKRILIDSTYSLSKAHVLSKIEMMNLTGYGDVNKVFNYCNMLIADPLIEFALPKKPNFVIDESSVVLSDQISELDDSIDISIKIKNWGKAISDSLEVVISNESEGTITFIDTIKIEAPVRDELLKLHISTNNLIGVHTLKINLDPENIYDEIYEDDNLLEYTYSVYSSSLRPIEIEKYYAAKIDTLQILNPTNAPDNNINELIISLSTDKDFADAIEVPITFDTLISKYVFNNLIPQQRYWYRTRLNTSEIKWSTPYSFKNVENNFEFFIDKDFNNDNIRLRNIAFDSLSNSWKLDNITSNLKIMSAGGTAGKFASIVFNNIEKLSNTFFWGMASAEIDTITYEPYNIKYYIYPATITQNSDSLINYINSLPQGKLIALTISDDAAQTVLGFAGGTPVRRAIETLGSLYIDSVRYRESWCIIGKKGAPIGTVQESYRKLFEGFATLEISKEYPAEDGSITLPVVGKSADWQDINLDCDLPAGSELKIYPYGYTDNGTKDTLDVLVLTNNTSSLSHIKASDYSKLEFETHFKSNDLKESPRINSIGINFVPPAELGTNYQVVQLDKDTIQIGSNVNLSFWVYNVGKTTADSFSVKVDVLNTNNSVDTTFTFINNILEINKRKKFDFNYFVNNSDREKRFVINIDPENKIDEYYEDNNFFTKSFYVKSDIIPPTLKITFDEAEVVNGDFVSNHPSIKISVSDNSAFPITDPNLVKVYLNVSEVERQELNDSLFSQDQTIIYKPTLEDGDYLLTVIADDNSGNIDSIDIYFVVSSETKLHQVYNYPNPFAKETYFTFRLSQIPDEVKIRIYTIAGRLIKEITKKSSELNYDLNKILWDGRDEDGDVIANGTYLYKMIIKDADKIESVTQKLVILK